jgi:CRP-like cAMP-binding protein
VALASSERRVAAGETIVERWDTTRDFFVVREGLIDVIVDGEVVTTLRAGDYFGEIAALNGAPVRAFARGDRRRS